MAKRYTDEFKKQIIKIQTKKRSISWLEIMGFPNAEVMIYIQEHTK